MSTLNKNPKHGVGIDLGSAFMAISICELGNCRAIESTIDGTQIPTIVYANGKSTHVGKDAVLHSFNDTGDHLYMHAKRSLPCHAREKIYAGKYTPIDVTAMELRYGVQVLLAARPDLAEFPQFGGTKRPAEDLVICLSCPANWGVAEHDSYEEAIKSAGICDFDGFVAESIVAVRRVARVASVNLKNGDRILVADIGAGTFDIAALQFRDGVFDQIAAASGDAYLAGHDFTNALAQAVAKLYRVDWRNVYDEGGLNLSKIAAKRRPWVVACWNAAEEAKKKLSVLPEVTVAIEFPKGRKTHTITRESAETLWEGLFARFKECLSKSLDGADFSFADINHAMLVGGSSRLPRLREAMAEVMGRDASDIIVCTDSEHIVSDGAAEHAFFQDACSQALENGLGFRVLDRSVNLHRNLLMIPPGQIIPPDGLFMQRTGFAINNTQAQQNLVCEPFVCRTGVRAAVVEARETFLEDTETVRLEPVQAPLNGFPGGEHAVSVGVKADPNRNLWLLVRSLSSSVEPLSIRLRMATGDFAQHEALGRVEILLLLDVSGSMAGHKIEMLREGAKEFARTTVRSGATLGVVIFPDSPNSYEAKCLTAPTGDESRLLSCIDSLDAGGGTPMEKALDIAGKTFTAGQHERIAVLFTDGHPGDENAAVTAAGRFKRSARLIAVGIGEDVHANYLQGLASAPSDYFYARCPENILGAFKSVAELLWTKGSYPAGDAAPDSSTGDASEDDYETDWDEIDDEEEQS